MRSLIFSEEWKEKKNRMLTATILLSIHNSCESFETNISIGIRIPSRYENSPFSFHHEKKIFNTTLQKQVIRLKGQYVKFHALKCAWAKMEKIKGPTNCKKQP